VFPLRGRLPVAGVSPRKCSVSLFVQISVRDSRS
jgi:hypothetical protein